MKIIIILVQFIILLPNFINSQIIVIDPGHNYDDIISNYKTETEVNTNWAVANRLKEIIEDDPSTNWDVFLTRENNNPGDYVDLSERELLANGFESLVPGEVYFLSIHCNAGGGFGAETFYCNNTFKSNNPFLIRYSNNINNGIIEHGQMHDRQRCVECYTYFVNDYGQHYHLGVLDNLTMPNCLNEIGFVDNPDDLAKLTSGYWRRMFAWGYYDGLKRTFADLNIISYAVENLPCYANNEYYCKIHVTIKNVSEESFNGDVRAMLRHFPTFTFEEPLYDFCQLGTNQNIFIMPGQQRTMTFESNISFTMELGMALCLESKPFGVSEWDKVSSPSRKEILKIPINSAKIDGIIYGNNYNPLQGAEIWSYKRPILKATSFFNDFYDPTTSISNKDGQYELLMPFDWEEAVISVKNYYNYDEILVAPIANNSLTHYYTYSPVVIGTGSGSGDCIYFGPGKTPDDPKRMSGFLSRFEHLTINGQKKLALICKDKSIRFGVDPIPVKFSKIINVHCGGESKPVVVYGEFVDSHVPWITKKEDCNWFGGNCSYNPYSKYLISVTKCNHQLYPIGNENMRWFTEEESYLDLPKRIGKIDLNTKFQQMGIELEQGEIYRIKLAYNTYGDYGEWIEKSTFFYVLPDNVLYKNKVLNGEYYSSNNMEIKNSNIFQETYLIVSNKIEIYPNTKITGKFHASIDDIIQNYSCSGTKNYEYQGSNSINLIKIESSKYFNKVEVSLPNREVTKLPISCACNENNKSFASIEANLDEDISAFIYPNPTNGKFEIIINKEYLSGRLTIYNSLGEIIKMSYIYDDKIYIDISNNPQGIYLVQLTIDAENYSYKIVKE